MLSGQQYRPRVLQTRDIIDLPFWEYNLQTTICLPLVAATYLAIGVCRVLQVYEMICKGGLENSASDP